jgi:hypothetical protein
LSFNLLALRKYNIWFLILKTSTLLFKLYCLFFPKKQI